MRVEIDRRAMAALATGHMAVDFAGGALPALLPFFHDRFHLSYTLAAVLVLASSISSSVVQPLFGLWSDRRGAIWLLPAGAAVGGIGIALASASPAYGLVVLCVVVSGLGTAAYHPEGSKFAAYASGTRRASGMSLFSVGGNVGYALGALVTTPIVVGLGLTGGLLLMVPCLAVAGLLLRVIPSLLTLEPDLRAERPAHAGPERPGAMALLLAIVAFRSVAWFGLITFVPLWEHVVLGHSRSYGAHLLALMLATGAVGTLLAGPAADRFGRRPVLMASNVVVPPAILVFVLVGGIPGAIALCVVGPAVVGTFGVTMVMSQEYLPRHIGMASGLSIGLSIGLGGVAAVILGAVADSVDLRTALYVCAAAPVLGAALTVLLPPTRTRARLAPEIAPS
jgi:FSR family fosmidomycin resistance protein-like MFS transporter